MSIILKAEKPGLEHISRIQLFLFFEILRSLKNLSIFFIKKARLKFIDLVEIYYLARASSAAIFYCSLDAFILNMMKYRPRILRYLSPLILQKFRH